MPDDGRTGLFPGLKVACERSLGGALACGAGMFLASLLLVLASAFSPITVHHQSELAEVRLGLPVQFVVQDQSGLTPPLPYRTSFSSPWEYPTRVLGAELLLSITFVFAVLCLVVVASLRILRRGSRYRTWSD